MDNQKSKTEIIRDIVIALEAKGEKYTSGHVMKAFSEETGGLKIHRSYCITLMNKAKATLPSNNELKAPAAVVHATNDSPQPDPTQEEAPVPAAPKPIKGADEEEGEVARKMPNLPSTESDEEE